MVYDYLDSLDSVRNSDAEVTLGQNELLDRLFYTDHTVVLTMQQLTDSRVFGNLLGDKECTDYILFQFSRGRLRYSQYGNIKTPSQYVQNSLIKCRAGNFLFSYLPIVQKDTELLDAQLNALKYGSLEYIKDIKKKRPDAGAQMEFLENYTRLILLLGTMNLSKTTPKTSTCRNLTHFLDIILRELPNIGSTSSVSRSEKEISTIYIYTTQILYDTKKLIKEKLEQSRSVWHNYIRESAKADAASKDKRPYWLAEAVVDIAYNLTLEDSINGCRVPPDGTALNNEIHAKLITYWEHARTSVHGIWIDDITSTNAGNPIHHFLKNDNEETYNWSPDPGIKKRWKDLKTLAEDMDKTEKKSMIKRSWQTRLRRLSFRMMINCVFAIILYIIIEFAASIDYFSFIYDFITHGTYQFDDLLYIIRTYILSNLYNLGLINTVVTIFIIGTLFSVLSSKLKVEGLRNIIKKLIRGIEYLKVSRKSIHKEKEEGSDATIGEKK